MNDLMRDKLMRKDGTLPLWAECVAGGMVSFCITDFETCDNPVSNIPKQ